MRKPLPLLLLLLPALLITLLSGCNGGNDATTTGVSGTITLDQALAGRASPDDTVFLFARMPDGPPMPLAVHRLQVRDLPAKFELDDSDAMTNMRLSQAERLVVVARVSKGGMAGAQAGDLEGRSAVVTPGTAGIEILIDQVLP